MTSLSKRCTKCGQVKPVGPGGEFHRNTSTVDGWAYWCRTCIGNQKRSTRAKLRGYRTLLCVVCQDRVPVDRIDHGRVCVDCARLVAAGELRQCGRCRRILPADDFGRYTQCSRCREYKKGRNAGHQANHTPPSKPPTERELVEAQKQRQERRIRQAWEVLAADRRRIAGV